MIVVGLFMVVPGTIFLQCIKTIYRADEGFKRAKRTIDPEELRSWASREIKKRGVTEIPDYIQKLYPGGPEDVTAFAEGGPISRGHFLGRRFFFTG